MGRTNDAIIYGGQAHLFVTGPAADAKALAEQLPSTTSRDYGRPFAEVFKAYKGDFYSIDPMLFSPARAIVTAVDTGETFHAGQIDQALARCLFRIGSRRRARTSGGPKIAIAVDLYDWHARDLGRRLCARGRDGGAYPLWRNAGLIHGGRAVSLFRASAPNCRMRFSCALSVPALSRA